MATTTGVAPGVTVAELTSKSGGRGIDGDGTRGGTVMPWDPSSSPVMSQMKKEGFDVRFQAQGSVYGGAPGGRWVAYYRAIIAREGG